MNELNFTAEAQRRRDFRITEEDVSQSSHFPLRLCASAVNFFMLVLLGLSFAACAADDKGKALYQNDFSKVEIGKLPEEMLLLDGGFAVQDVGGNKVLQLPGAPLDTFGVLFGPTEPAGLALSERVHSARKGRREPAFA